ncbi:unnamed protein product [Eruca vesicaria subsp. sativa]|uniref:Uncharacterized protein n=1 Tax=Eruca vesicaria subsp. sativa TaxID=29727 RepID=A0ABC8LBS6_ERUVS|nr:unnamed protein product [Eruca vesicaria subsp. sativa]
MDLVLQEMTKRTFPLCECFLLIDLFVESSSQFKNGLVNHAFAAALRALLLVCDIGCYFCGLSSHGGKIGTSVSTWKTFHPRIMVLLTGLSFSENRSYRGLKNYADLLFSFLSAYDGIHARIGCSNSVGFSEALCGLWCA